MQIRQATADFPAYTSKLKKRTIPANAILHDFRTGRGHQGLSPHNPDVASFHYEGEIYFNVSHEVLDRTVIVSVGSSSPLPDL